MYKNHAQMLLVTFLLTCIFPAFTSGQVRVTPVKGPNTVAGKKGVYYALPRTVLRIDVWVSREQRFPGPFETYSEEFLGSGDVIRNPSTQFKIEKAEIIAVAEPDPDHYYFVEHDEKATDEAWLAFTQSGLVAGAIHLKQDQPKSGLGPWNPGMYTDADPSSLFSMYSRPIMVEVVDTILRQITVDTTVIETREFRKSFVPQSDKELARDALSRINRIDQDRYNLLVGYQETPYDQEALAYMIAELDKLKGEYMKLFTGVVHTEINRFSVYYIPEKSRKEAVVAGFSPNSGLTDGNGSDLRIELEPSGNTTNLGDEVASTAGPNGFYYRIPEPAIVRLIYQGKVLASASILIGQLGVVKSLPPDVSGVEFYPETGALKRIMID